MARSPTWVCSRQANRVKCGAENLNKFQLCQTCGKRKPKRKTASHLSALKLTYEQYIVLNGGEFCGICGRTRDQLPDPSRKLDRDHTHDPTMGVEAARGLLCRECNRKAKKWLKVEWVRMLLAYLERVEQRGT